MNGKEILKQNQLHQTPVRLQLLSVLEGAARPLSVREIEALLPQRHDRVTLYRTLKLFVDKQMVNRIAVSEQLVAYRIHADEKHLHFHCNHCNAVYCLPKAPVQPVEVPTGFVVTDNRFVVNGVCNLCNENPQQQKTIS